VPDVPRIVVPDAARPRVAHVAVAGAAVAGDVAAGAAAAATGVTPSDPRNLWPEPRHPSDGWTADRKDELEAELVRLVCRGDLPLNRARRAIASDWRRAWLRYVGRD
jgi:hypothetical protein